MFMGSTVRREGEMKAPLFVFQVSTARNEEEMGVALFAFQCATAVCNEVVI